MTGIRIANMNLRHIPTIQRYYQTIYRKLIN